jgi:hypothetical protein
VDLRKSDIARDHNPNFMPTCKQRVYCNGHCDLFDSKCHTDVGSGVEVLFRGQGESPIWGTAKSECGANVPRWRHSSKHIQGGWDSARDTCHNGNMRHSQERPTVFSTCMHEEQLQVARLAACLTCSNFRNNGLQHNSRRNSWVCAERWKRPKMR